MKLENEQLKTKLNDMQRNLNSVNNDSIRRMDEAVPLENSIENLKTKYLCHNAVKMSIDKHLFYTGITCSVFQWLAKQIESRKLVPHQKAYFKRSSALGFGEIEIRIKE